LSRSEGTPSEGESGADLSSAVLRAKYLDYCSARVAELLLTLTADEMYLLAQEASRELDFEQRDSVSYTEVVRLATDRVARMLSLPDYRKWVREYRKNPRAFDAEIIGLWESEAETGDSEAPDQEGR